MKLCALEYPGGEQEPVTGCGKPQTHEVRGLAWGTEYLALPSCITHVGMVAEQNGMHFYSVIDLDFVSGRDRDPRPEDGYVIEDLEEDPF